MINAPRIARLWWVGALLLATIGFAAFGRFSSRLPWKQPSAFEALIAAAEGSSCCEARLVGFPYSAPPMRTGGSRSSDWRLLMAVAKVQAAASGSTDPERAHDLGVARLVMGDYDEAIDALEQAVAARPRTARFSSDLAAAYLARAGSTNSDEDFFKALALAERAVRSQPDLLEAAYNRALALERLPLPAAAHQAYEDYLGRDNRSPWAAAVRARLSDPPQGFPARWTEARRQLEAAMDRHDQAIVDRVLRDFPEPARELFEDDLLPQWAERLLENPSAAAAVLTRIAVVASGLTNLRGDPFFSDTIAHVQTLSASQRPAAARAFLQYRQGRRLQRQERTSEAAGPFLAAAEILRPLGSPFHWRSLVEAGYALYAQGRTADATAAITSALTAATTRRYKGLDARAASTGGIVQYAQGQFAAALASQRRALELYEQAGELETAASIHQAIAEPLRAIGELRESWSHVRAGLNLVPMMREARRRHSFLASCALGALRQGLPEVAVAALDEDLRTLAGAHMPVATSESLINRARAWQRLGNRERAGADLERAAGTLRLVPDAFVQRRLEAELSAGAAEILQDDQPELALQRLSESLARYGDVGSRFRQARLLLARGRILRRLGRNDEARRDLHAGIATLEGERSAISMQRQRVSHFDEGWDLYGELIRLEASVGRPDEAFAAAERSRARSLLDASGGATSRSPEQIAQVLPPRHALLAMSLADDRVLLWLLTREGGVTFASSPLATGALQEDLRAFAGMDPAAFDNAARHLYSVLIEPFAASLQSATTLVIVPDGSLFRVPFAALNAGGDRYLSDTHRVLIATSATVYAAPPRQPAAGAGPPAALVVANPSVGNLELPGLPAAEREAEAINAIYPGATVLLRDGATPRRFVAALDSADLLHFAGHALVSEDFPWLSRLMLASEANPARGESVFVHELEPSHLKRLRLVVLAACSTGAGAVVRGEGVLNLARPFLLSGTPFVVVTAWDIADDVAAQFFATFHASYRATSDPIESLSAAQRHMRRSSDARLRDPRSWSGYMLVGGIGASQPTRVTNREDN